METLYIHERGTIKMASMQETIRQLEEINRKYDHDDVILSTNMMVSYPRYTSASRMIMIANQLRQCVILDKTEKPRVFTNYENMIGDNSDYNFVAEDDYEVTKIIKKFSQLDTPIQPYLIFFKNLNTGEYTVQEVKDIEDLPEKYGFEYDNSDINNLKTGDIVRKGDPLRRPTSYDEYGNWGFGRNIPCMFMILDDTIEDAVVVSESLAHDMVSAETETIKVMKNENNFLLNIYGDDDNYKVMPDIGEAIVGGNLCVKRTIHRSQVLYDMTNANTRRRMADDVTHYMDGVVVDIDIFCNKKRDEIPDTVFNEQLLRYIDMATEYRTQILEYTQSLLDNGEKVSTEIRALNKRAKELLDEDTVIKDENNSEFSEIVMYIKVKKRVGLHLGQKIAGRHGNKGVISKIVPDHEMPHVVETGETVHVIFNALGIPGRLNFFQVPEQAITFILDRQLEKIKSCDNLKDKEKYLFRVLEIFNPDYCDWVVNDYKETCKTKKQKEEYFKILERNGIYLHIPPYWDDNIVYDSIDQCFEEFPWIQPYTTAFWDNVSQRWVPMINKQIVGSMYIMKLKQSSKKGLIARSTGAISRLGVPCKSDGAKKHLTPYSQQPIRQGDQEYMNQLISISADTIVKKAVFSRTSPIGRRELGMNLFKYPMGIDDIEVTGDMTNRNVDILNCYLLIMGRQLVFEYDVLNMDESEPDKIKEHLFQNELYYCTTEEMKKIVARKYGEMRIQNADEGYIFLGTEADLEKVLDEIVEDTYENIIDELEY